MSLLPKRQASPTLSYSISLTITSGAVVALFTAGAFFGAGGASPTADLLGRRWTMVIGSIVFLLGGGLQTGAPEISYLMAGRFFAGFGVGFLTMIIPIYQAEIAHPSIRGNRCVITILKGR